MQVLNLRSYFKCNFIRPFLLVLSVISIISCSNTVRVYHPPRFDLTQYERLGIITFTDNADPSVGSYATQQFQNQIHSAQIGIPILALGTEEEVLKSIQADQLDFEAFQKIGQKYKVVAVFHGNVHYSDIEADVSLEDISDLNASLGANLHSTLSAQLYETQAGATIWSESASWKRKLGKIDLNSGGSVTVGMKGYHDAYRKLIPDMVYEVTKNFRGRYIKEKISKSKKSK